MEVQELIDSAAKALNEARANYLFIVNLNTALKHGASDSFEEKEKYYKEATKLLKKLTFNDEEKNAILNALNNWKDEGTSK